MALPTISIDIETTGLYSETCDVLEIGLVYADLSFPVLDTSHQLRIILKHDYIKGKLAAFCMNLTINYYGMLYFFWTDCCGERQSRKWSIPQGSFYLNEDFSYFKKGNTYIY